MTRQKASMKDNAVFNRNDCRKPQRCVAAMSRGSFLTANVLCQEMTARHWPFELLHSERELAESSAMQMSFVRLLSNI